MIAASGSEIVAPPYAPARMPIKRDADLDGRQELRRRLGELERHLRALIAFLGALLQPHLPGRHHGNLGHRKDAVGQHQQQDDDDLEPDAAHSVMHCHWAPMGRAQRGPLDAYFRPFASPRPNPVRRGPYTTRNPC